MIRTDTDDVVFHVLRLSAATTRRVINEHVPENHYADPAGFLVLPFGRFGADKLSMLVDGYGLYVVDRDAHDPGPQYEDLVESLDRLAGYETPWDQMPDIILDEYVDREGYLEIDPDPDYLVTV